MSWPQSEGGIDQAFADAGFSGALEWDGEVGPDRWAVRYRVAAGCEAEFDPAMMPELNSASATIKRVFDPHIRELDPRLE